MILLSQPPKELSLEAGIPQQATSHVIEVHFLTHSMEDGSQHWLREWQDKRQKFQFSRGGKQGQGKHTGDTNGCYELLVRFVMWVPPELCPADEGCKD